MGHAAASRTARPASNQVTIITYPSSSSSTSTSSSSSSSRAPRSANLAADAAANGTQRRAGLLPLALVVMVGRRCRCSVVNSSRGFLVNGWTVNRSMGISAVCMGGQEAAAAHCVAKMAWPMEGARITPSRCSFTRSICNEIGDSIN